MFNIAAELCRHVSSRVCVCGDDISTAGIFFCQNSRLFSRCQCCRRSCIIIKQLMLLLYLKATINCNYTHSDLGTLLRLVGTTF